MFVLGDMHTHINKRFAIYVTKGRQDGRCLAILLIRNKMVRELLVTFGICSTRLVWGLISDGCRTVLTVNDTPGNASAKVSILRQIVSMVFDGRG
jgi:hypothetical protein